MFGRDVAPGDEAAAAGGGGSSIASHLDEAWLPARLKADNASLAQGIRKTVEQDAPGWLAIPACSTCTAPFGLS